MNNRTRTEIFNRSRRRSFRSRAYSRTGSNHFLLEHMANEAIERLGIIKRTFNHCLVIGPAGPILKAQLQALGIRTVIADIVVGTVDKQTSVVCDEDRLPFADGTFDLILNIGVIDTVNDLPGMLILTRRILKPDGLLLGAFVGAESLTTLKSVLIEAEGDRVAPHLHPQIDIRTFGDLLTRAGMALPVVDSETLTVRYSSFRRLIEDIRDWGGENALESHAWPIRRATYKRAIEAFAHRAKADGKTSEHLEIIYICAWSPHASQPKPARRGSGGVSLKDALSSQ